MPFVLHFNSFARHYSLTLVDAYSREFRNRLLTAFDAIEAEADAAANAYFQRQMERPAGPDGPDDDGGGAAEAAQTHGLEVYEGLAFVKKELMGLSTAGLYHLWERLLKEFLSREFTRDEPSPMPVDRLRRANFASLLDLLITLAWNTSAEAFREPLNQLHLIANVVKHGEGPSFEELIRGSPQLFRDYGDDLLNSGRDASDLELKRADFDRFGGAVRMFFERMPARMLFEPDTN